MKTAIIFALCIVVSVGIAASSKKPHTKKMIVLGEVEIESITEKHKSMKQELEQFQLETRQLKKHLLRLQKTIKSHSVHTDNNIKINERF